MCASVQYWYYIISQRFTGIVRVPNTICPGVAGFVSWTAVSSVLICWLKLLPFTVTMVIVPPWSVACRGTWSCSLCWPLQKWNLQWEVLFVCVFVLFTWGHMNRQNSIYTNNLTTWNVAQICQLPLFHDQFISSTVSWVSVNTTEKSCTLAPICKITKGYNYYLHHACPCSYWWNVMAVICQGWRLLDMNLFNWCAV